MTNLGLSLKLVHWCFVSIHCSRHGVLLAVQRQPQTLDLDWRPDPSAIGPSETWGQPLGAVHRWHALLDDDSGSGQNQNTRFLIHFHDPFRPSRTVPDHLSPSGSEERTRRRRLLPGGAVGRYRGRRRALRWLLRPSEANTKGSEYPRRSMGLFHSCAKWVYEGCVYIYIYIVFFPDATHGTAIGLPPHWPLWHQPN